MLVQYSLFSATHFQYVLFPINKSKKKECCSNFISSIYEYFSVFGEGVGAMGRSWSLLKAGRLLTFFGCQGGCLFDGRHLFK